MRGAAAQDRQTPGNPANTYQDPSRQHANRAVHADRGQSTTTGYRTGDVRR